MPVSLPDGGSGNPPDVARLCEGLEPGQARVQLVDDGHGGMQVDGCLGDTGVKSATLQYLGDCMGNGEVAFCTAPMIVQEPGIGANVPGLSLKDSIAGVELGVDVLGEERRTICLVSGYEVVGNHAILEFLCQPGWNNVGSEL